MHVVVFVPGTMGTELFLPGGGASPEKVWPPEPLETQFGYKRRAKLADPRVVPGRIISKVLCFDFYQPVLDLLGDLGFTPDGTAQRLIPFPYDWRLDLFDTAARLAQVLDAAHDAGASRISLVGHSMGGLICRLLLEARTWRGRPWFGAIDQFIAIATPHLGAPLALGRVLGIDSALGISGADFAWLASREEYPSAYQLLPAPGEQACWNQADPALAPLDIYAPDVARSLGLSPTLLARVRALHEILGPGAAPPGKRYFYFAAAGHRTATRVNVFLDAAGVVNPNGTGMTLTADGGDGTVPMFSALPSLGQRHIATNEHATAFKGDAFRRVFVRLLGGDEGPAVEVAVATGLVLSVEAPLVTAGQDIEVLLYAMGDAEDPHGGLPEIGGELVLHKLRDGTTTSATEVRRIRVAYAGPPVDRLRLYLEPVAEPGHYQLRFEGSPGDTEPARFGVCAPLPTAAAPAP
jgi:pimeloyl-ACP methyl ester carboxylesterase